MDEPAAAEAPTRKSRARRIATVVLVVLSALAVLVSSVAVWAKRTVLDTGRFTAVVEDVIDDPAVTAALATAVTNQVLTVVDAGSTLENLAPDALDPLVPVLVGALANVVEEQVQKLLETEQVQGVVLDAVALAHEATMRLLRGDGLGEGITVQDGTVTLNLLPIIERVLARLQEAGIISSEVTLPELGTGELVPDRIAALGASLGVTLPEDLGQITVYESQKLADAEVALSEAQRALAIFERAVVVIVVLTLLLIVVTVLLSPHRRRTAVQLGIGVALALFVSRVIVRRVVEAIPEQLTDPDAGEAARRIVTATVAGLDRITGLLLVVALIVALVAFLAGPTKAATSLRARAGGGVGGLRGVVAAHPDAARLVIGVAAVLLLWWWGLDLLSIVAVAVIVVGGLVFVSASARARPAEV